MSDGHSGAEAERKANSEDGGREVGGQKSWGEMLMGPRISTTFIEGAREMAWRASERWSMSGEDARSIDGGSLNW